MDQFQNSNSVLLIWSYLSSVPVGLCYSCQLDSWVVNFLWDVYVDKNSCETLACVTVVSEHSALCLRVLSSSMLFACCFRVPWLACGLSAIILSVGEREWHVCHSFSPHRAHWGKWQPKSHIKCFLCVSIFTLVTVTEQLSRHRAPPYIFMLDFS